MGRPAGSKNKPKTNGDAGAKSEPAKPGHNSAAHELTDDERRALMLHHKRMYLAADALVEKAKADRKAVTDLAASDLGKGAVGEIKEMIELDDEKKLKARVERTFRLARWMGLPVGTQANLFEQRAAASYADEGKTAGMSGERCDPPEQLAIDSQQEWIRGWHDGQAILARAFGKRRDVPAGLPEADTSEPAFG